MTTETRRATTSLHDSALRTARRASALLAAGAALGLATAAPAQDGMVLNSSSQERYREQAVQGRRQHDFSPRHPPRNGRFIYGHWTPYDPPSPDSYPPEALVHVIRRGDTLSQLAEKYYRDLYLWPYIWDANPYVTYPHWIYPGDTLLIPPLMVVPSGRLEESAATVPGILSGYFPAGGEEAVYCGHYIADPNLKPFGEIIESAEDPNPPLMAFGNLAYVNIGAKDGVLPGDEFAIIYPREHLAVNVAEMKMLRDREYVRHPHTGEKLGIAMKMSGRLRIVLLGDEVSTAEITYSCDAIEAGWELHPFAEVPIPLVRRKTRESLVNSVPKEGRGYIVWVEDRMSSGADGSMLSIDLGSDHGVMPGDVFRIFRDEKSDPFFNDVEHLGSMWDMHNAKKRSKLRRDPAAKTVYGKQEPIYDVPPRLLGEIVVLYAEKQTATARVFRSTQEFMIGDSIVYEPVDSGLSAVAIVDQPLQPGTPLSRQPQSLQRRGR